MTVLTLSVLILALLLSTACGDGAGDVETTDGDVTTATPEVTDEGTTDSSVENETTEAPYGGDEDTCGETDGVTSEPGVETTEKEVETTVKEPETTEKEAETTTHPTIKMTEYTVNVVDGEGNPMPNVVVQYYKEGVSQGMKVTNRYGSASFDAEVGAVYTVALSATDGKIYVYDESLCEFDGSASMVTVTMMQSTESGGEAIMADPDAIGTREEYYAPYVGEGTSQVTLKEGMNYFLFTPARGGIFELSSSRGEIGYYGSPFFVLSESIAEETDTGALSTTVRNSSINAAGSTVRLVIGVRASSGGSAKLSITRVGDPPFDPADEPWTSIKASDEYLKKEFEKYPLGTKLHNVSITDDGVELVYNETDGFYHLGTSFGPIVYLRIDCASPYIASFVDICDRTALGAYIYDEDGKYVRKQHYNEMIAAYYDVCDENGVVPLNDELIEMVKTVGEHMGWWNSENAQYLFAEVKEITENAWMFACCYY